MSPRQDFFITTFHSISYSLLVHKLSPLHHYCHCCVLQVITRNLNRIIDINYYPVPEAKRSNLRHRPIGIGVQGLADVFILMRYPFDGEEAQELNKKIFETIYYAALTASCEMAQEDGPYETYEGSPVSKGVSERVEELV